MLNRKKRNKCHQESGGAMLEYAIIVSSLLATFVVFGIILQRTTLFRAKRSAQSVNLTVPCYRGFDASDPDKQIIIDKTSSGAVLGYTGSTVPEECM